MEGRRFPQTVPQYQQGSPYHQTEYTSSPGASASPHWSSSTSGSPFSQPCSPYVIQQSGSSQSSTSSRDQNHGQTSEYLVPASSQQRCLENIYYPDVLSHNSKPVFTAAGQHSQTNFNIHGAGDFIASGMPAMPTGTRSRKPQLKIIEEPEAEHRFRYITEGTSHGILVGRSPNTNITVQLTNFLNDGHVHIMATLYTVDRQRKHFHKLKGKSCTEDGSYILPLDQDNTCKFSNCSVLRTEHKKVHDDLYQEMSAGHQLTASQKESLMNEVRKTAKNLKLNLARICFQAFDTRTHQQVAPPVFSEPIVNTKSPLKIIRISKYSSDCVGGKELFLLCEAVNKKDITIRFFETDERGKVIWQGYGLFGEGDVHHQVAIVFKTPPYKDRNLTDPVEVKLQLCRRGGKEVSPPVTFVYRPSFRYPDWILAKRGYVQGNIFSGSTIKPLRTQLHQLEPKVLPGSSQSVWTGPVPSYNMQEPSPPQTTFSFEDPQLSEIIEAILNDEDFDANMDIGFDEDALLGNQDEFQTDSTPSFHDYKTRVIEKGVENAKGYTLYDDELSKASQQTRTKLFEISDQDLVTSVKTLQLNSNRSEEELKSVSTLTSKNNLESEVIPKSKDFEGISEDERSYFKDISKSDYARSPTKNKKFSSEFPTEDDTKRNESRTEQHVQNESAPNNAIKKTLLNNKLRKVVHTLWKQRVSSLSEKLQRFCITGDVKALLNPLAELLGNKNADGDNAIHLAVIHQPKNSWLFQQLLGVAGSLKFLNAKNNLFQTPLHLAVSLGETSLVKLLLLNGADPNSQDYKGNTPMHIAVLKEDKESLAVLLNKELYNLKGQPLLKTDVLNYNGDSALHLCVLAGDNQCLTLLLEAGADPNVPDGTSGRTPLHLAVETQSPLIPCLLQQSGLSLDAQDLAGNSPLHLASFFQHHKMASLLVDAGANPGLRNWIQDRMPPDNEEQLAEEDQEEDWGRLPSDYALGDPEMQCILSKIPCEEDKQSNSRVHIPGVESPAPDQPKAINETKRSFSTPLPDVHPKEVFEYDRVVMRSISRKECEPQPRYDGPTMTTTDPLEGLWTLLDPPSQGWEKLASLLYGKESLDGIRRLLPDKPARTLIKKLQEKGLNLKDTFRKLGMEEAVKYLETHLRSQPDRTNS